MVTSDLSIENYLKSMPDLIKRFTRKQSDFVTSTLFNYVKVQ